jgi:hypothetical protein
MNSNMVQSGHVPIAVVRFYLVVKIYLLTFKSHYGPHPLSQPIDIRSPFQDSKAAGVWIWRPISFQCHPDLFSCPQPVQCVISKQAQIFFLTFNKMNSFPLDLNVRITDSCAVAQCSRIGGYQDLGGKTWNLKMRMALSNKMFVCSDTVTAWHNPGS